MLGRSGGALLALALAACHFDAGGEAQSGVRPDAAWPGDATPFDGGSADADDGKGGEPKLRGLPGRLTIDGDLADVGTMAWQHIEAPADFVSTGGSASDARDLAADLAVRWAPDRLYLAVLVTDDVQHNEHDGDEIWRGDSLQAAFDMGHDDDHQSYDTVDDFEYGWARRSSGIWEHRWISPAGSPIFALDAFDIERVGDETRYEVSLSPSALGVEEFAAGLQIGFSIVVNEDDDDGAGRAGFLEWSSGVGAGKNPSLFGTLRLQGGGGD